MLDVGSPYAYDEQALLYCPLHLPDPRNPSYEAAMHDELAALIEAAEGRTLALFTSWRAMSAAARGASRPGALAGAHPVRPAEAGAGRPLLDGRALLPVRHHGVLAGRRRPRVRRCRWSPSTGCRFPGPTIRLLQARRASLGRTAFELIDVPRAATCWLRAPDA